MRAEIENEVLAIKNWTRRDRGATRDRDNLRPEQLVKGLLLESRVAGAENCYGEIIVRSCVLRRHELPEHGEIGVGQRDIIHVLLRHEKRDEEEDGSC